MARLLAHLDRRSTFYARIVLGRLVSDRRLLRGKAVADGRVTLLTVAYRSRSDVDRLLASYRRFVSPDWPAVVVENSGPPRRYRAASSTVGVGRNLTHGLGLDFGMCFVHTEYVLVCDPDSIVVGDVWAKLRPLVDTYGAASIDLIGTYHPICLAFRTETWKATTLSLRENWQDGHDVAGALAPFVGGVAPDALLRRSRGSGKHRRYNDAITYYLTAVYDDVFSSTIGGSRALFGAESFDKTEGDFEDILAQHDRWRAWATRYLAGTASLEDFPA